LSIVASFVFLLTQEEDGLDLGISGKVAVVIGGESGIGAACVKVLAQEGSIVSSWDLQRKQSENAISFRGVDVTKGEQVQAAWNDTEERLGPVEILVHAAAIGSGYFGFPFTQVPVEAWHKVLEVNILGMANVAHVAGPAMQSRKSGSMVFLTSIAGQMGSQTDPPYSASKAANINFAQCMAKDLAPHGVRVNCVSPGMVKTPLNASIWEAWNAQQPGDLRLSYEEWATRKIRLVVPLGRWQQAEDIAAMVVFLSSPRSSEVTGQTINVDGGSVMHS
jgi:2-hydroxycyclohexanecarboxyl-CoA dehydrogenase